MHKTLFNVLLASTLLTASASAADQVSFQFSWLVGGDRAAFYVAQQQGLFAQEDLEVELLAGRGSSDAITKVATGVAQMGEGGLDALLTAKTESEVPVTAVMPLYTKAPDAIAVAEDSGIASLSDLAGKRIATSPFTSSVGPWPFVLEMNGVAYDEVETINADAATLPAMLATGQVDGIIQYVTNAPATGVVLEEAGKTLRMIPWADYGLEGYSASIFVNDTFLAENRDVVIRFTRALKRAEEMMRDDPAMAAAAVVEAVPELDLGVTQAVAEATLPLLFNENTDSAGLGVYSPELVETTWSWVARQRGLEMDALDPMAAVDFDIANEQ